MNDHGAITLTTSIHDDHDIITSDECAYSPPSLCTYQHGTILNNDEDPNAVVAMMNRSSLILDIDRPDQTGMISIDSSEPNSKYDDHIGDDNIIMLNDSNTHPRTHYNDNYINEHYNLINNETSNTYLDVYSGLDQSNTFHEYILWD